MQATSRRIVTNQAGPHQGLETRVARALQYPWRKPIADHTREAFAAAARWREARCDMPLMLDAGCGVGISTRRLAEAFPDHALIGVDRSDSRLSREHGPLPGNVLLIRADLVDFWRLSFQAGWRPARHYLLYPNPYPKASLLKLRWHGHPVLPFILALGGRLELRSNWRLYLEEFSLALRQATGREVAVEAHDPGAAYLTPFEKKYHLSGQPLWRLVVELPHYPQLVAKA
ncbi:MAG: SAM-dependent methyltransferase [Halomonas sp.]|uniref:tRNA (guanine(46)-N(7))-methyltransferase TrmB n=1 Tax=Halomonas sp. TaxID=1486246 RepID=UPI001858021B|nr:SAM-dependent methyltransferase [Halomonas sp.]NWN83103.1 SAM-dependent methyltransferase [Halomonas sp.]